MMEVLLLFLNCLGSYIEDNEKVGVEECMHIKRVLEKLDHR